jgi:hypothetical protein
VTIQRGAAQEDTLEAFDQGAWIMRKSGSIPSEQGAVCTQAKGGEGSAARAQLQAGSATLGDGRALPLSRIAVQTALELSDELNVDEMVAVELIVVTNQEVRHLRSHVPFAPVLL